MFYFRAVWSIFFLLLWKRMDTFPSPSCFGCKYYVFFSRCRLFDHKVKGKSVLLPAEFVRNHEEYCGKNGTYFEPKKLWIALDKINK